MGLIFFFIDHSSFVSPWLTAQATIGTELLSTNSLSCPCPCVLCHLNRLLLLQRQGINFYNFHMMMAVCTCMQAQLMYGPSIKVTSVSESFWKSVEMIEPVLLATHSAL